MRENRTFTFDGLLRLRDAYLQNADAAAQVSGADQVLDLGGGFFQGNLVLDLAAVEIDSGDEVFTVALQGGSDPEFSSQYEDLALVQFGASAVLGGDVTSVPGRYVVPARNERNGTVYRYLRLYTRCGGTLMSTASGGGVSFAAYLADWGVA